jgi:hypothetical protein
MDYKEEVGRVLKDSFLEDGFYILIDIMRGKLYGYIAHSSESQCNKLRQGVPG